MTATSITRADPAGLRTLYDTARARGSGDVDRGMTEMSAEVLVSNHAGDDLRTAADRLVFPRAIEMLRNCAGLPEDEAQQRAAHITIHAAMQAQELLDDEGARGGGAVHAQRQLLRRPRPQRRWRRRMWTRRSPSSF